LIGDIPFADEEGKTQARNGDADQKQQEPAFDVQPWTQEM
jgi:hypothetical protein